MTEVDFSQRVECACGCGTLINRWIDYGGRGNASQIRERKYVHGHNKPWLGRSLPQEMCKAISERQKGTKQSSETIEKRRRKLLGREPWNKGLSGYKTRANVPRGEDSPLWKGGPPKCKVCGVEISHSN